MSDKRNTHPIAPIGASGPEEPSAIFADDDEPTPTAPTSKPKGVDGFGLGYRAFFRFQYALLHVIGPPRLSASLDPRTRMKADYLRRKELREQWKASQVAA